jgi:hypothetical protein
VHGIDYNHNSVYDNVLDRSELNKGLTGESTAPALCGSLVASQTASTGSSRGSTRTYAFVLNRRVAATSTLASDFVLSCDLLGADVGAIGDRRSTAATAT